MVSPYPIGENMKKLLLIPMLILVLVLFATPVLAADPPDMDVDIGIGTPGDVDLDVGINAGGDVDITIDGVDFKQTANTASSALNRANDAWHRQDGGAINSADWYNYWYKEMAPVGDAINQLNGMMNFVMGAEAKLIEGDYIVVVDAREEFDKELVQKVHNLMINTKKDGIFGEVGVINKKACCLGSVFGISRRAYDDCGIFIDDEGIEDMTARYGIARYRCFSVGNRR